MTRTTPETPIPAEVARQARRAIAGGGVVAFPTETYYGLGADPRIPAALERVLRIKGRDGRDRPLLLLIGHRADASVWAARLPPAFDALADAFWPGPLTVILPAAEGLSGALVGPGGGVALRLSSHPVARELPRCCGTAVTGTSANRHGESPATDPRAVRAAFGDELDLIIDGGATAGGPASTLVDLTGGDVRVVRAGAIDGGAIENVVRLV